MTEQMTLIDPPSKTVTTVFLSQIEGAEGAIPSASLIESMMKNGQLTPIIVEYHPERFAGMDHPYTVVAGRRRVAAARHLGWEEIDAVIYAAGDINPAEIGLIENAMRSPNPMSEVEMIFQLEMEGKNDKEISKITGMAPATIEKRRRMGNLDTKAADALAAGRMAIGVAEEMAKLPLGVQGKIMEAHREGRITGRDVREAREVMRQGEWTMAAFADMAPAFTASSWREVAIGHLDAAMSVIPIEEADTALLVARIKALFEERIKDADSGSA